MSDLTASFDLYMMVAWSSLDSIGDIKRPIVSELYGRRDMLEAMDIDRWFRYSGLTIRILNRAEEEGEAGERMKDLKSRIVEEIRKCDLETLFIDVVLRDLPDWNRIQYVDEGHIEAMDRLRTNLLYMIGYLISPDHVPKTLANGGLRRILPLLEDRHPSARVNALFIARMVIENDPIDWYVCDSSIVRILQMQTDPDDEVKKEVRRISELLFPHRSGLSFVRA